MLLQLGVLALSLGLMGAWGLPVAAMLRGHLPGMILAAPAFGASLLAIGATLLYVYAVPIRAISIAAFLGAVISACLCHRTLRISWRAGCRDLPSLGLFLLFGALLAAPILRDRVEFTVFQGNQWDHFNYITMAEIFSQSSFDAVRDATRADELANPLLAVAQRVASTRPSVSILFAVIAGTLPGALATSGYAFITSFAIAGMLAFAAVLQQICLGPRARRPARHWAILCAGLYACSFWGQYPLDIDAWSQAASVPVMLAAWGLILAALGAVDGEGGGWAWILALGILVAGLLYLYPEAAVFHAAILVGVLLLAGRRGIPVANRIGVALGIGLGVALMFWPGTLGTAGKQALFAATKPVDWWQYYDAYLFGRDPSLVAAFQPPSGSAPSPGFWSGLLFRSLALWTGLAGILGLYFLTPANFGHFWLQDGLCAAILALIVVGVAASLRAGWRDGGRAYRAGVAATALGLLGAVVLALIGQSWAAGKALSFVAPLLAMVILAPALIPQPGGIRRWLAPLPWIGGQACFIALALIGLTDPDGIRLPSPYPGSLDVALKHTIDWDIADQLGAAAQCSVVEIQASSPFFRNFAALALVERHRGYFYRDWINAYYGIGQTLGHMPAPTGPIPCVLTQRARATG
jgi:hypothetical protein